MTALFIAIAALLTLLVVAWVVRPLLRPAPQAGVSSQRLNAAIYRDQLAALERDLARGAISPADHEATRDELQLRLLDDTEELPTAPPARASFWSARRTAAVVALVLPLGAAGMYWWLGTPQALDPASAAKAETDKVMQMVDGLAAKLKANPDNPKGWAMLARSYKVLGRLSEAEQAFTKIGPLLESDPDLLADYADLLAARAGGSLEGPPMVLVNKALGLDPLHPMSLMLAGTAAYRQGNFAGAAMHWEKMLTALPPGSPDAEQLQTYIAEARAKAGMKPAKLAAPQAVKKIPPPARPGDASVSGVVELDAALKARAAPDDVVMVIARVPGTRMPVAVLRTRAADLPLKFTLDDALAMSPQARISMASEVDVEARISKSGMAQPEVGDLISAVQTVKVGTRGLKIRVAKVRP
jgi:cytochrome c-type biogenesis protein CcmH